MIYVVAPNAARYEDWRNGRLQPECRFLCDAKGFAGRTPTVVVALHNWQRGKPAEFVDAVEEFNRRCAAATACACGHSTYLHVRGGACWGDQPDLIIAPDPPGCGCVINYAVACFGPSPATADRFARSRDPACECGHGSRAHLSGIDSPGHCRGGGPGREPCYCAVYLPRLAAWRGVDDQDFFARIRDGLCNG